MSTFEKIDLQFLIDSFKKIYKTKHNDIDVYFAPGRINLIGEHTDYTGGLIFASGIDRGTYILARKNNTTNLNLVSLNYSEDIISITHDHMGDRTNDWTDYVKGVYKELAGDDASLKNGADVLVYGNIPNGAGLSSSASLEMAAVIMFLGINDKPIPIPGDRQMVAYSLAAQKAENNFVKVNCGIMDQFVVANARLNHAIKLDCFNLNFEYSTIDLKEYALLVINSHKKRRLEESAYNQRRLECEQGFEVLKNLGIKKEALGRVTVDEWDDYHNKLDDSSVLYKRLRHVIYENQRVKEAYAALKKGDLNLFAQRINESGDSLKIHYEVTGFHLDTLVEAARSFKGVIASRMTGAGFGGCTINIVKKECLEDVIEGIRTKYFDATQLNPDFYIFSPGDGARAITM